MSKNSRNSDFKRKSGKNRRPATDDSPERAEQPRRAYGMRGHPAVSAPRSPKKMRSNGGQTSQSGIRSGGGREGGALWIWGTHAAKAALMNPKRTIHDILLSEAAAARTDLPSGIQPPRVVLPAVMDKQFPRGTVHQGMAVKAAPLEWPDISDIAFDAPEDAIILVLDQITDPHNVGAMLRLCSAFGVSALVMQDRKAPPLGGACAKVAVGCLETIPVCLVTNIANTLKDLQKAGFMVTGLAGETDTPLSTTLSNGGKQVIVMGAEGPGLRPRVRDCCDQLARIPMLSNAVSGEAESLNVATAAGIALYEARRV